MKVLAGKARSNTLKPQDYEVGYENQELCSFDMDSHLLQSCNPVCFSRSHNKVRSCTNFTFFCRGAHSQCQTWEDHLGSSNFVPSSIHLRPVYLPLAPVRALHCFSTRYYFHFTLLVTYSDHAENQFLVPQLCKIEVLYQWLLSSLVWKPTLVSHDCWGTAEKQVIPGDGTGDFITGTFMTVTLSCDHRVVDGQLSTLFSCQSRSSNACIICLEIPF